MTDLAYCAPPATACRLQILKRTRGKLMHNATDPNLCCPSNEQFVICRSWICPKMENFKTVKHSTPLRDGYQFYTILLELIFQIPAELFACISQSFKNILILGVLPETRDTSFPRIFIFCTYFKIEFLQPSNSFFFLLF